MKRPPDPKPHLLIGNVPFAGKDPVGTFLTWAPELAIFSYYRDRLAFGTHSAVTLVLLNAPKVKCGLLPC